MAGTAILSSVERAGELIFESLEFGVFQFRANARWGYRNPEFGLDDRAARPQSCETTERPITIEKMLDLREVGAPGLADAGRCVGFCRIGCEVRAAYLSFGEQQRKAEDAEERLGPRTWRR
jgi:hypothetical protein